MQPTSYAIQSHEALSGSLCRLGHLGEALAITERALELGSVNRTVRLRQLWLMALTADTGADLDGWIQALELDRSFPRPSDEHVRTLFVLGAGRTRSWPPRLPWRMTRWTGLPSA